MTYTHRGCGHTATPSLHCPACREPVGARDMRAQPRPPRARAEKR